MMKLDFKLWFEVNDDKPGEPNWLSDLATYHRGLQKSHQLLPGHVTVYPQEYYTETGAIAGYFMSRKVKWGMQFCHIGTKTRPRDYTLPEKVVE